ncbi:MAG TPA: MXAN_5187 C-terminal domain-containing protein [Myxococcota bacterium]|nr:MXAN_5187 C-terminal domain-containing protein [Myxococcota bacterium]
MAFEDDLQVLETKLKQLRLDYDQYFLGTRPREPVQARSEVQKLFTIYQNTPIQNTALRFRFNSLCARYFALRRQWDLVLRQIEEGSYSRHVFKANLHDRTRSAKSPSADPPSAAPAPSAEVTPNFKEVYDAYLDACRNTGEDTRSLTRERMDKVLQGQADAIRKQFGCEDVRFRVVVEGGKARLKATPVGGRRSSA